MLIALVRTRRYVNRIGFKQALCKSHRCELGVMLIALVGPRRYVNRIGVS